MLQFHRIFGILTRESSVFYRRFSGRKERFDMQQINSMARPLVQALQQNIAKAVVGKDEAIELN